MDEAVGIEINAIPVTSICALRTKHSRSVDSSDRVRVGYKNFITNANISHMDIYSLRR